MPDKKNNNKENIVLFLDIKKKKLPIVWRHGSEPVAVPQELEDLLPARAEHPIISADVEEVELSDFDRAQGAGSGARREAYNDSSDEEGGPHGPGVQCAHQ